MSIKCEVDLKPPLYLYSKDGKKKFLRIVVE